MRRGDHAGARAASLLGGVIMLFAMMAVNDIHDKNIGLLGLHYIVKQALGNTVGNVFLVDAAHRDHRVLPRGPHGGDPDDVRDGA